MSSLPSNLTLNEYNKAVVYAKLASKAYDLDDWLTVRIATAFFSGIDEVLNQDFRTPVYGKVGGGGNWIDWWGGGDQGLDYTIFENKTTKDLVIAFRGTEPLSFEDWIEDAEQALGSAEQYKAAVKLARETKAKIDKENEEKGKKTKLSYTGHSLGGGLATAAALATGCEAIVFDAAGVSNKSIENEDLGLDVSNASEVTNFNVQGCFVSDWNGKMDDTTLGTAEKIGYISKQYGKIIWLENVSERARFLPKGLLSLLVPGGTPQDVETKAETFLAHAWHVFTYQLEHKNFVRTQDRVRLHSEAIGEGLPAKKPKLVTPSKTFEEKKE